MTIVERLGYIGLGVSNLEEAVSLYSRLGRLEETERQGRTAFMTAGRDHHWIRLEETGVDEVLRVGYDVGGAQGLSAACEVLKKWNIPFEENSNPEEEHVERRVRFTDPGGMSVELFYGMSQRSTDWNGQGLKIKKLLHAGWLSPNIDETARFYQEGLGFKLSDEISGRVIFMRCGDRYHHSLVLIRGDVDKPQFGHFCFLVDSLNDVMRVRANALHLGAKLGQDVMRHVPSGSTAVYLKDTARNIEFEYCCDHAQIDDATHRPRVLPNLPETGNIWLQPLSDPKTLNEEREKATVG